VHASWIGSRFAGPSTDSTPSIKTPPTLRLIDEPFGSMRAARAFLDNLPLTHDDRARINHRYAEQLLGL
jgi:hypothetical protein